MIIDKTLEKGRRIFYETYPVIENAFYNHHKINYKNFDGYIFISFWLNSLIFYYLQCENKMLNVAQKKFNNESFKNNNYSDFKKLLQDPNFNYFISKLLKNKKKNFIFLFNNFFGNEIEFSTKQKLLIFTKKIIWKCLNLLFRPSYFPNLSLKFKNLINFFFATRLNVIKINFFSQKNFSKKKYLNKNSRIKFYKDLMKSESFNKNKQIYDLVTLLMPLSFFENFHLYDNDIKDLVNFNPPSIFLDGPEVYDEYLKILIGYWVRKKTKINNIQHSSNHIDLKRHSFYDFWFSYSDLYISWGWKNKQKNLISLPSLRLYNMILINKKNNINLLYDLIFFPRVNLLFPHFSLHLNQDIQANNLRATEKLFEYFHKRKIKLYLKPRSEDKSFYKFKKYFLKSLDNTQELYFKTKLSVFNHFSSGFFECLFLNRPAVIYIPNKNHLINESPSYREMNNVLDKYGLICTRPSEILDLYQKIDGKFFQDTFFSLKCDKSFKKQILNPINSYKEWVKFFNKK